MESLDPPLPPALERLPLDILEYICQFLGPKSLASLALVSRPCCLATTPQRFARVKFSMLSRAKLQHDLQQWIDILDRGDRFRHVRRVVVAGSVPDIDDKEPRKPDSIHFLWKEDDDWDLESNNTADDYDSDFKTGWFVAPYEPDLTPQHKQAQHSAWIPFARFLVRLPGLTDFFYTCTHQMPACVLHVLHTYHPRSRLHVPTFSLRSLCRDADEYLPPLDPDEFALATSPCLYSAHLQYREPYTPRRLNFNLEAVAAMVFGWAPGLRRLSVRFGDAPSRPNTLAGAPEAPWEAMLRASRSQQHANACPPSPPALPERRRASLEALVLSSSHHGPAPDILQTWGSLTDFSALRRFGFHCYVRLEVFADLAALAAAGTFRSLRELHLSVSVVGRGGTAEVDGPVSQLLQALAPLEELKLLGCYGKATLEAALRHHGQAVRKLIQTPRGQSDEDATGTGNNGYLLGPDRIRELEQRCPGLEEACFYLPRSRGGPDEVAMYRALGRLPRLRRLRLMLKCYPAIDEAESWFDAVCRILANAASDEALGQAIWNEIAGAADSPLEHLRIDMVVPEKVHGDSIFYFDRVLEYVGRSVLCLRDEARGPPRIQAVVVDWGWMRAIRKKMDILPSGCIKAWSKLWPERTGDWRDDWHSFPLWSEQ